MVHLASADQVKSGIEVGCFSQMYWVVCRENEWDLWGDAAMEGFEQMYDLENG